MLLDGLMADEAELGGIVALLDDAWGLLTGDGCLDEGFEEE